MVYRVLHGDMSRFVEIALLALLAVGVLTQVVAFAAANPASVLNLVGAGSVVFAVTRNRHPHLRVRRLHVHR